VASRFDGGIMPIFGLAGRGNSADQGLMLIEKHASRRGADSTQLA